LQEFEINQENEKNSKAIEPNLVGLLAHSSTRVAHGLTGPALHSGPWAPADAGGALTQRSERRVVLRRWHGDAVR
jgi:hypothetical protein